MAAPVDEDQWTASHGKSNVAGSKEVEALHDEFVHTDLDEEPVPHLHAKTILIVVAVVVANAALTMQLVATGAFPSYVAEVVGGADIKGWMITTITIILCALGPPVCQAADYWGRRWFLIILTCFGVVGCIVTSRTTSMGMAIAGEALVGVSFASTPLLFAIPSEVLPHRHRVTAQAWVNVGQALGGIAALMIGAGLIKCYGPDGFRILWYINAAFFTVSATLVFLFYRPPPRELQLSLTFKEKIRSLDWVGFGLVISGLTLFVMGFSWAENPYPWKDAHVIAPLLVGIATIAALVVYESVVIRDGMFNHELFSKDRNFALGLSVVFFEGLVFIAANIFYPFQVAVLYETNQILASLEFSIAFFVLAISGPVVGVLCYKFRKLRLLVISAFITFLVFAICMASTSLGSQKAVWVYPIFLGYGLAGALSGAVSAAQLSAPPEFISITSGLVASIRSLGVTIGAAIYGSIFSSRLSSLLPSKIAAAALPLGLPASSLPALIKDMASKETALLVKIPGISEKIIGASVNASLEAYKDSFQSVWIATTCFAAVGLVVACFLLDPVKDLNMKIDAPAESEEKLYGST